MTKAKDSGGLGVFDEKSMPENGPLRPRMAWPGEMAKLVCSQVSPPKLLPVTEGTKLPTANAFFHLWRRFCVPNLTEEESAKILAQMEKFCARVYPNNPEYCERLVVEMSRWSRSPADLGVALSARGSFLEDLAVLSAEQRKQNLAKNNLKPDLSNRDMKMAKEFHKKKKTTDISKSALMADIGRRYGLRRSASIEAIKRGQKLLASENGTKRKQAGE